MGAWVNFANRITIAEKSYKNGVLEALGYSDITEEIFESIVSDEKLKYIQISRQLPAEAFQKIEEILLHRPDITFRIFGLMGEDTFELSMLRLLPHLQHLQLEAHLTNNKEMLDYNELCSMRSLKSLYLKIFDLRDYSFVQALGEDLEELRIHADTMSGSVQFDCKWLLRFKKLQRLYLGDKAKKNIKIVAKLPSLKQLTLRGIKLESFDFLKDKNLESLAVLWCGMDDLSSLTGWQSLKALELWRIMNLEDMSFVSSLTGLEELKLQDLKHVHALPDLTGLPNLKHIVLNNVPVEESTIPETLRALVETY